MQYDIVQYHEKTTRNYGENCSLWCQNYLENSFRVILDERHSFCSRNFQSLNVVSTNKGFCECVCFGFVCCFENVTNLINSIS